MGVVRWIIGASVFLALLFLSLDNAQTVTLRVFRVTEWQAPLIFVVFCAFAVGVALGLMAGALRTSRVKRQLNKLRREQRAGPAAPAPHGAAPEGTPPPYDAV